MENQEPLQEEGAIRKIKKYRFIITILTILVILLLMCGAYLFVNWNEKDKANNNAGKESKFVELATNDELVLDLYDMISYKGPNYTGGSGTPKGNYSSPEKLPNNMKLWMSYNQMKTIDVKKGQTNVEGWGTVDTDTFSINNLELGMKKVFGKVISYKKEDFIPIDCKCNYQYQTDKQTYYCEYYGGCGGDSYIYLNDKINKVIKNNTAIEIYEKYGYVVLNDYDEYISETSTKKISAGVYKDFEAKELVKAGKNLSIDDYLKELPTAKYTFKLSDDGNYYFYSSELID